MRMLNRNPKRLSAEESAEVFSLAQKQPKQNASSQNREEDGSTTLRNTREKPLLAGYLIFQSALTFYVLIQQAAKIKPNLKNSQVRVSQICPKTSCSKFWPRHIHWEQKRHQLAINKKVKFSCLLLFLNLLCTFVIAEQCDSIRKISLAITRQITQDINLLLIKTTAARSSQVAVMTSHCS